MGDVGDQFGFQPLTFHALFDRAVHPFPDAVEVFSVPAEIPEQMTCVDTGIGFCVGQADLPGGQVLRGPLQPVQIDRDQTDRDQQQQVEQE